MQGSWTIRPCPYRQVALLARELGISELTAAVLVRRGYGTPETARAFLAAEPPGHDPFRLGDMRHACERIRGGVAAHTRICVHGDYDVDGICATALAVLTLRELGADVSWHLPSRFDEGYGVSAATIGRLADEGVGLVLTVDCGITAVAEVAEATARGLEDVVPLVDENRALATAGLLALARTQKQGLQALMACAGVDPAAVDAGGVGFRLAPRINAAGRLGHPGIALDLLLTEDKAEAKRLANDLERLNRDRQGVEERIVRDAIARVEEWPEAQQRRRGYVLADEGWHEGVIGIVASRLVERFHRPVVLIAGGEEGWKGSGRSIPSFDLHAALGASSAHLERFGGHRAAAGLSIRPERVDAFTEAFAREADATVADEELIPVTVVDAILPRGTRLTLDLCAELARLAPFGLGNPQVTLLAADCELADPQTVGDGKHLRFRVRQHGLDAGGAIAFGLGGQLDRLRRPGRYDVAFRLEENRWNGTVAPQLMIRRVFDADDRFEELYAWLRTEWEATRRSPEAQAVFDELESEAGGLKRHPLESEAFRRLL